MRTIWRGPVALLAVVGVLWFAAGPAAATTATIPATTYAASGVYCSNAEGWWNVEVHGTGLTTVVSTSSANYSLHTFGLSCGYSSPASYNTLAVWTHMERWSGTSAVICKSTPWTPNAAGDYDVYSGDPWMALGCGAGSYRQHIQARITYGGTNYLSDSSSMTGPLVTSWVAL